MSNIAELRNKFDELGIVYHFYDCQAGHNDEDFVLFNTQVLIPLGVSIEKAFIASDKSNWFILNENPTEDSLNAIIEAQKDLEDYIKEENKEIKFDKSVKESIFITEDTDKVFVDFVNKQLATFLIQKNITNESAFGKSLNEIKEEIESKYYKNLDKFREITHYDDYYCPNFTYKNDLKELLFASTLFNDNGIPLADKNELFKEFFLENVSGLIGGYMQEPYDENSIIFDEPLLEKNAKEFKDYLNALGYDVAILKDLKESDGSENYYSRDTYCAVVYANNMLNLKEAFEHLVYTGDDNPKYKLIDIYPSEKTLAHLDEEIKEQNHIRRKRWV